jgi:hypothetical protein
VPRSARTYSAKLLFQFRVVAKRKSNLRRICEERIVTFKAASSEQAWKAANRLGRADEFTYRNDSGGTVHFEYVGIMELLHLGLERSGPTEVWYDIVERFKPSERRSKLLPRKAQLQAFAGVGARTRASRARRSGA